MTALVCSLLLFGSTIKMNNGEIFVGKIIRESDQKIWFQLERGGSLVFQKNNVQRVDGKLLKKKENEEKKSDTDAASPLSNPGKAPAGMPADQRKGPAEQNKINNAPFLLDCPAGFYEDATAAAPPYLLIYKEKGTKAVVSVRADPLQEGFQNVIAEVRKRAGADLKAERVFRVAGLKYSGRLFTCVRAGKKVLVLVVPYFRICYSVKCSVGEDLFPGYESLFLKTLKSFSIARSSPRKTPASAMAPATQKK